ncbi:arginine ABC transporter, ATP-binding protein ArtM [Aedoeadaptatus coxii]|uniref:Arginine ABC transporter, ATP-binding protein ArtM n=1 Tax=Aedoeadaptatus coxii TaxID=755172 RepID=A0A134ABX6_9FIRM|nr:amino acid ABC transporter ATP-binding protein [Peptoniphilus coxii]KXB65217.1 arginine ABC transporter, ATP-binding protein ArtM [Peptoniphilus coxii]
MIKVEHLSKSFNGVPVFENLNFQAKKGEVVSIIGPSGTGKSTFLRCINFLETPDKGTIEIDGLKVDAEQFTEKSAKAIRLKTSMVFQNYSLFKNKTALENIMIPLVLVRRMESNDAKRLAMDYLQQVGLLEKKDAYPSRLSGGQQQRIGIARAMAVNPKVMLLDEPTSSLDPELVGGVLEILKKVTNKHSYTTLVVTHEMKFARDVSDRVIFMDKGNIVEEGSPEEIFTNPKNTRTREFLRTLI